jgi:prolipoprotein diacylglyceryl transferase
MYPKVSDLINDVLGTHINLPIQSYGMMVALAFVAGGIVVRSELKRKAGEGLIHSIRKKVTIGEPASPSEILVSTLMGFLLGLKIIGMFTHYSYFADNPQDYIMSWQGSWLGGFLFAAGSGIYTWYTRNKARLPKPRTDEIEVQPYQLTINVLFVAAIFGILGAKIFDVIEHLDDFFADPLGTLFSFSGLAFYGGLIVAAFAVLWYARRNGIPPAHIADVAAPALMIAYAVGRIGCQISGDGCWGIPNLEPKPEWLSFLPDWMWAFDYPHNVINEGIRLSDCTGQHCHVLEQPVFPTPFYETLMCTFFFGVLWAIRKRIRIAGMLFGIYLMMNGLERFLIESIRINQRYDLFAGIRTTQAEAIAIALMLTGLVVILRVYQLHRIRKT